MKTGESEIGQKDKGAVVKGRVNMKKVVLEKQCNELEWKGNLMKVKEN